MTNALDTGAAPKQQQQVIPQTTAISNIKLPILKKEEYDIWAMEMEHYLEYIDNDVNKMSQPANDEFSQHLIDDEALNHEDASDIGAAPKQQQQVIPQTTAISNIKHLNSKEGGV
ncbi:hypothetical protein Tco_0181096 [Tanacetum coccineum]